MIYFLCPREGGKFIRIERKHSMKPTKLIAMFEGYNFIAVFKCGMVYDSYLKPHAKTNWRHCISGGRRAGKKRYAELLTLDLPTEVIS